MSLTLKFRSYTIAAMYNSIGSQVSPGINGPDNSDNAREFIEFRRKVRGAEVLSAAMERLLKTLRFSGRISVVVQNGRVLKSGYEEGFFRHCETLLDRDLTAEP